MERFDEKSAEEIVGLRPDLVIATTAGTDPRLVSQLRALGLTVATTDVTSFERLEEACRMLGSLLDRTAQAEALAFALHTRAAAAAARVATQPLRHALYVVWWEPLIVAASGTFHDNLLRRAGLSNLAPEAAGRYPRTSRELLLDPRLDVVVAPDEPDMRTAHQSLVARPEGRYLASGRVEVIWLPANPASRPGPRLVEALESLVAARANAGEKAR
jgi:iron complex transport system substrate-binding protein